MKSSMCGIFKRFYLLFLIAIMAIFPVVVMAQGRTLTRANRFDHGGLQPGDYLKIEKLGVFEGTWEWVSAKGDSVLTFQLWREKLVPPADMKPYVFSFDIIAGHYSLSVNGVIVSNNTNKRTENNFSTFRGTDFDDDGMEVLESSFQDFVKNKWAPGRFELFRDNPDMARWSVRNREITVVPTGTVFHRGFSLPNNVVLQRVQDTPPAPEPPPGWEVQ